MPDPFEDFWFRVVAHLESNDRKSLLIFEKGAEIRSYSGSDLLARLPRLAARIAAVTPAGSLVLIVAEDPEKQWMMFLAAMWAGRTPGLLTPPTAKIAPDRYAAEFRTIGATHKNAVFVVTEEIGQKIELSTIDLAVVELERIFAEDANLEPIVQPTRPIRFYQQSSGTTGIRKGMIVDERRLLAQLDLYGNAIGWRQDDVVVSWLPLYHDMGLIAAAFGTLLHGSTFVCTSPFHWLAKPRWLIDAFHRHEGTLCWLPNFAFEFMVHRRRTSWRVPETALSSVRLIVNCSEVTSKGSMDRFADCYGDLGLTTGVIGTCYALAENVFAVTQSPPGESARGETADVVSGPGGLWAELVPLEAGRSIASSGRVLPGIRPRVDGEESPANRKVGQIGIAGPALLDTYTDGNHSWPISRDSWYETSDLGYMSDGELFVLGRADDMINRAGNLIDPVVIERAAQTVTGIKLGRVAVFGVDQLSEGTQGIVLLAEPENPDTPTDRIRQIMNERVSEMTGLTLTVVHIVPPGWLMKSSSGKISRQRSRDKYLNHGLSES